MSERAAGHRGAPADWWWIEGSWSRCAAVPGVSVDDAREDDEARKRGEGEHVREPAARARGGMALWRVGWLGLTGTAARWVSSQA